MFSRRQRIAAEQLDEALARVVDELVGPEGGEPLALGRTAGRDRVCAEVVRHLHGEMTDAIARGLDEDPLAGL